MTELTRCPSCAAECIEHTAETAEEVESWVFDCGAEILRWENGKYTVEAGCDAVLRAAVKRMNDAVAITAGN